MKDDYTAVQTERKWKYAKRNLIKNGITHEYKKAVLIQDDEIEVYFEFIGYKWVEIIPTIEIQILFMFPPAY